MCISSPMHDLQQPAHSQRKLTARLHVNSDMHIVGTHPV